MKNKVVRSQYRLPINLRDWLKRKAESNNRSMNGELVELMQKAKENEETEKT